jgi:Gpi18-like mannosyltransferase
MDTHPQSNSIDKHQFEIPREKQLPTCEQSTTEGSASAAILDKQTPAITNEELSIQKSFWVQWYTALKQVFPIYLATHLAFLLLTYAATLFTLGNFSSKILRVHSLLDSWYRWDTGRYIHIATFGYDQFWTFAFFPLYPLLEKGGTFLTHDPFVAGLLISNLAGLGLLVVLYRLVEHDFDAEHAWRTALYLAVFPTAFFFAAAYNESLFLLLTVLSFYFLRQANWWLAGLCGLLAALTRSVGLLLFVPFCYEYLRQHRFHLRALRFDLLAGALIPAGLGIYALYCFFQFHDALAFSHAQSLWNRRLQVPWYAFLEALHQIQLNRLLSFISIHNVLDLSACLFIFVLLVLCWVGPWKFSREQRAYSIYAAGLYGWFLLFPTLGNTPLVSYSRFMLEVFPAFIVLAAIGRKRQPNLYYLTLSVSLLSFLLLQFLTGHWMV